MPRSGALTAVRTILAERWTVPYAQPCGSRAVVQRPSRSPENERGHRRGWLTKGSSVGRGPLAARERRGRARRQR